MSAPSTVDDLIQLIRKSGMVDESQLTAYLHRHQGEQTLLTDPRDAADQMVADGVLTQFQAEQFVLGKWRGFTVGKYKLLERVGVGGMGQVFLCEHLFMKRRVAIKILPPAKAEQPAALGRFYREARAAGQLEHPNVVRTHDIDQDGNLHYIVMEYVDGSNLLDMVKQSGPMAIGRAVHYIRQVADGLQYAFENGLVHRDIKPGNVLVDRSGTAKLLDLGLARFYQDQSDMLTIKYDDKIVLGTADYVAPEQVANSHTADIRADVYALGGSLYYLLAGHPPFPTGTVSQKLLWHRTKDPAPLRQVRPEVPERLAAVVTKMMQKDPALRYQTPGEVAAALAPWTSAEPPRPGTAEMPVLSKAAWDPVDRETRGQRTARTASTATVTASSPAVRPSPFGTEVPVAVAPRPGEQTPSPFQSFSPTADNKPGGRPKSSFATLSPLTASAEHMPDSFPVIAPLPPDHHGKPRTARVVVLVAAVVVLATSLFLYKFVLSQPAPTPVEQQQSQQ